MRHAARRDTGDIAAHAAQYAAQTGMTPEAALEKFGLAPPDIPPGGEEIWNWFWELHAGRGATGFGPLPLSWGDMDAWARLAGLAPRPWEAAILRRMDAAWLDAWARTRQPDRQAPSHASSYASRSQNPDGTP